MKQKRQGNELFSPVNLTHVTASFKRQVGRWRHNARSSNCSLPVSNIMSHN